MDTVIRSLLIYAILVIVMRFAGRRTLNELTTFDFVLLLIIGEATQQALLGDDFSVVNAVVVILTLVGADIVMSLVQARLPWLDKAVEGVPMVIVEDGRPLLDRIRCARISEDEILEAARRTRGLARMDQIRWAVLEVNGGISVIPKDEPR